MTTTNTAAVQLPTTNGVDYLLDLAAEIVSTRAAANRRDRAMMAAHADGCEACEVCGRALKSAVEVQDSTGARVGTIGPECARKIRKMLAAG